MNHFFVDPELIQTSQIVFPADVSHQIVRVLRLKLNDHVVVLDNQGNQLEVVLEDLNGKQVLGRIIERMKVDAEPELNLHLLVAFTQREKFEWILQKCCELGVRKITPLITERSLIISDQDFAKKKERWVRILKEAAEQSRRGLIPVLENPLKFEEALRIPAAFRWIAWEHEISQRLDDLMNGQKLTEAAVCIGPEGGFSNGEIQIAQKLGWQPFSLGKRILRMETAAVVACALLFHLSQDI